MSDLEAMKKNLPEGSTKQDHQYVVENFVTSVFTNTDSQERTCETITKRTAQDFNRCSHFIMLLTLFDEAFDDGWEEKKKYCVFKAGTIMKALKSGEQPPRGNPNDPEETGERKDSLVNKPPPEEEKIGGIPPVSPPPVNPPSQDDILNFDLA